jgi:hypothetical protein
MRQLLPERPGAALCDHDTLAIVRRGGQSGQNGEWIICEATEKTQNTAGASVTGIEGT